MHEFTYDMIGGLEIEGKHELATQRDIDEVCIAQANLAGELLDALISLVDSAQQFAHPGALTLQEKLARARHAISKSEAI